MTIANTQAEAAMLGYYLERGVEGFLSWRTRASYYTDPQRRAVFNALERLTERGESIEPVTVLAELRRHGEPVKADFVADLVDSAAVSGGELVRLLEDCETRRAMQRAGEHFRAAAHNAGELPGESIERILANLAQQTAAVGRLEDAPEATALEAGYLAALDEPKGAGEGIVTGLLDLDHRTPGELPRGELTTVAARTGVGKTAFGGQVAAENARRGRHVLFCSAEMTTPQLLDRFRASAAGVPLEHLRARILTPNERRRIDAATFPAVRLYDKPGMTTPDIRTLVARFAMTPRPIDLLVVDHLHHLADPLGRGETRYQQVSRMVAALKDVAKRFNCALLVLAQLNRQAAERDPTLADLRDSGAIEEFSSVVLLLHRSDEDPCVCNVDVAKHRNGPTGRVRLYFDGPTLRFRDFTTAGEVAA